MASIDKQSDLLLTGDVAVVTGAAQGNGAAIARGLGRQGASVAVVDSNRDGASSLAEQIRSTGGVATPFAADVANVADAQRVADEVRREFGDASILINNAGILRVAKIDDDGLDASVDAQYLVNVHGTLTMTRAFLPQLRRTRGRIVNVGSMASFLSVPDGTGYAASKGAVLQITRTLAAELAGEGIRVNGIAPGVMVTAMTESARSTPEIAAAFLEHTPMGRYGDPDELAGPVVFLVSGMSSFVTGVMLPVDGGYLVH